ncbi:hypothetical protein CSOJ01_15855 [Colletotrichum sojae]|uniref:Uncharacterized protein n=1 Tax=Colletotrichum sojae TaxID=2175907 RepID=A0A8H6MI75_9PEZI|nr:hypothetical protein CSOJ01_15855 [Colletotrichum sojae]
MKPYRNIDMGFHFVAMAPAIKKLGFLEADALYETAINKGIAPLVRAATDDRQAPLCCLDVDAAGLVVPDMRDAAEAGSVASDQAA